jgi:osmotically-inducible protein OsmY
MTVSLRTDEAIRRDVLEELAQDLCLQPNEGQVASKDGIITLTGWVDSYLKKVAAEKAAYRVSGVKAVVNCLDVRLPRSAERADADLAEAVLTTLQWDTDVPTSKLEVTVSQGWVTLKGEVEHGFQKSEAERAIRRLVGIRGVTNALKVKPRVEPTDLKQSIEKALVRNAETDARNITVEVEGSKVILRGTVRSPAERRAAENTVWSAPGITEVENRIEIV